MAVWQHRAGGCVGRGFDSAGFLGQLMAWITAAPTAGDGGGLGWFIIDDKSTQLNNPYIVACNVASPNFNNDRAFFVRFLLPSGTGNAGFIKAYYHLWWDPVTGTGSTVVHYARITTLDSLSFNYDFRGGANGLCVQGRIGTSYTMFLVGTWTGDNNLIEPVTNNGIITGPNFIETGDTGNMLSGYVNMTGVRDTNTDVGGKLYFSIVPDSGNFRINIYKDSARQVRVATTTGTFAAGTTGAKNLTQDNNSGIGGFIITDTTVSATSSIEVTFNQVTLQAGQGALFTVGRWYYLYGFTGNRNLVAYAKVVSKSGDTINFDFLGSKTFQAGDVLNPYPFRTFAYATNAYDPTSEIGLSDSPVLPFQSNPGGEFIKQNANQGSGQSGPYAAFDTLGGTLNRMAPDDLGYYAVMRPILYEIRANQTNFDNGNMSYGPADDYLLSSTAGMAQMQDGRRLGAVDYIYLRSSFGYALCVRDTISVA